jgi:hypothetical protein
MMDQEKKHVHSMKKLGIILFHAKSIDGIEVLYLSTRESRSGKSEKLT